LHARHDHDRAAGGRRLELDGERLLRPALLAEDGRLEAVADHAEVVDALLETHAQRLARPQRTLDLPVEDGEGVLLIRLDAELDPLDGGLLELELDGGRRLGGHRGALVLVPEAALGRRHRARAGGHTLELRAVRSGGRAGAVIDPVDVEASGGHARGDADAAEQGLERSADGRGLPAADADLPVPGSVTGALDLDLL